jgi:hypothetical protein
MAKRPSNNGASANGRGESDARPKKRCSRTTKAGKRCRAWALHGIETCLAHADEKTRDNASFGGSYGGRPRKPRFTEILSEQVRAEISDFLAPYREGLTATRHLVVGNGPTAHLEEVPDIPTRMAAMDKLFDRTDGRPTQHTEISGEIEHTSQSEFDREVAALEAQFNGNPKNGKAPASAGR